ncbi:MAG TPA: Crp/Fnr family transcriptional regulator [Casimicrobiaceae bacterium]|nr:Crp/Fnr family transcriptional regulator [Casimicrobiaceae bacterium]
MTRTTSPGDPLAPLTGETLHAIAATGVVRNFPKNAILINEGDTADSLYIVLSGRIKVFASNEAGREIVLSFFGPGEYVGEMSLDGQPRSASVMTVEPTTCAIVNRASLREFVLEHPDFALNLIEKLIQRVRTTTENVKSLALTDVYGRLIRLITALAVERDGVIAVPERLTQQDIAERVGASRDMISRLMKDLVAGGYLSVVDKKITVIKKLPTAW